MILGESMMINYVLRCVIMYYLIDEGQCYGTATMQWVHDNREPELTVTTTTHRLSPLSRTRRSP